ncbi:MAG TPA: hypothetical protein VHO69_08415 [Phototrophicaceae bacterium]|nr:hypothetical protein [Phototrophicaceae bacterium]
MGAASVNQFFLLYGWFPLAILLVFLLLIARFYQRFANEYTYFRLFFIPIVLFGIAAVRYSSIDTIAGDTLADLLLGIAGITLIALCLFLYWLMTRNR